MTLDKYTNLIKKKIVGAVFEKIKKKKLNKGRVCKLGLLRWLQINENVKVGWWPHHVLVFPMPVVWLSIYLTFVLAMAKTKNKNTWVKNPQ